MSIINQLFNKILKEQKQIFLLGYFNINLLKCNKHQPTNEVLDSRVSISLIPYILQPTGLLLFCFVLFYNLFNVGHNTKVVHIYLQSLLFIHK